MNYFDDRLINISLKLCEENKCKLIYLAKSGSHRFGTSRESSDIDVDGLFIPSEEILFLCESINDLKYTTKDDFHKNTTEDIDIKLYSIQYFLKNLLKRCDTNAIDILYSYTNYPSVLYLSKPCGSILSNPDRLLEIKDVMKFSYTAFSVNQSKKYGIKSSKLGLIREIYEYLQLPKFNIQSLGSIKLSNCVHDLIHSVSKSEFLSLKEFGEEVFLLLDGKMHQLSIDMQEFYNRVYSEYIKYGERTKLAEQNDGNDWKSLSHALRGIFQMEELFHTGKIIFPLSNRNILRDIKLGNYPFSEVEKMISDGLERLESLKVEDSKFKGKRDEEFINNLIINSYK